MRGKVKPRASYRDQQIERRRVRGVAGYTVRIGNIETKCTAKSSS